MQLIKQRLLQTRLIVNSQFQPYNWQLNTSASHKATFANTWLPTTVLSTASSDINGKGTNTRLKGGQRGARTTHLRLQSTSMAQSLHYMSGNDILCHMGTYTLDHYTGIITLDPRLVILCYTELQATSTVYQAITV